jgi:hypothetical protein
MSTEDSDVCGEVKILPRFGNIGPAKRFVCDRPKGHMGWHCDSRTETAWPDPPKVEEKVESAQ